MSIVTAFLLVALGIALHATHGIICRRAMDNAWRSGYQQAAKEEQIRITTEEKVKKLNPPPFHRTPLFAVTSEQAVETPKTKSEFPQFPQSFVDDFQTHGRAACKLR